MSRSRTTSTGLISPKPSNPVIDQRGSFVIGSLLIQTCGSCGNKIILDAGDVIFGGKWYHAACWQLADGDPHASESES